MNKAPLILLIILFSCQQERVALSESDKAVVINEVGQTLNDYVAAIKKDGLIAEFTYLDNSQEFFWVPPGYKTTISYDSVAAVLKANAPLFKSIENSFDSLAILPLKDDLAAYSAQLRSIITDTSGTTTSLQLIETGLVIKRKDGWKLLCGQTSLINPK